MTREEQLEQQRVEIFSRLVIVEREVAVAKFEEMKYMSQNIGNIMDNQGWIGHLKREGIASVDLVWKFYTALLDVADLDAPRPIGAYPGVEIRNKPDAKDIFITFMGQDVVIVRPFTRQKCMLPFWRILHLIFAYDIEPRAHTIEYPIISFAAALSYSLFLTHFLLSVGYMDCWDKERKAPLSPICRTTLNHSEAQIRQQQIPRAPAPKEPQTVEEPPHHAQKEQQAWADA
ncbi:hypothetical protein CJ030_MR7G000053 [Morella rubra]|uniref:Uncharacterized protein n=1 Tax=Morella rubra TaxID=262757 RepID=A0A6A1V1M5_9ROSI|nr:hypothetical protein CJ030_MR7G000053 [Morella rubra]